MHASGERTQQAIGDMTQENKLTRGLGWLALVVVAAVFGLGFLILSKPSRMAAVHHLLRVFGGGLFPRPWIPMIILDMGIQSMLDVIG